MDESRARRALDDPHVEPTEAAETKADKDASCALQTEQPSLYGTLLAVNERIERTGRWVSWLFTLLWAASVVAVMVEPVKTIGGIHLEDLQSVIFYGVLAIVFCVTYFRVQDVRRTREYARWREDLIAEARHAKLDQAALIAALGAHEPAALVAAEIKADVRFEGRRR
ncbi:MAG: hypothetical protein P1V36_14220 [Planctomycetota bacterium]|nr:hypothetical protein [Planctomycetota bacterium]